MLVIGAWKPRVITFFDAVSIGAMNGCLTVGIHRELPADWNQRISRPFGSRAGRDDIGRTDIGRRWVGVFTGYVQADASAWRPYHAQGWAAHHLVVPIWQPLVVAMLLLGWTHGFLRGSRWRDPRVCLHCGHAMLPSEAASTCAECGLAQTTATMPRRALPAIETRI